MHVHFLWVTCVLVGCLFFCLKIMHEFVVGRRKTIVVIVCLPVIDIFSSHPLSLLRELQFSSPIEVVPEQGSGCAGRCCGEGNC